MNLDYSHMPDFEQVCRRVFSDSQSTLKLLLGGVILVIPVLHFFSFGYFSLLARQIRSREPLHLPEWEEWGRLFAAGVCFFVLFLIFAGGLFLAALLSSWLLRPFLSWLGYFPFIPAILAFAPLTAASWYRYSQDENWQEALDLRGLARMLKAAWPRLLIPTFAYIGFLAAGFPVFPLAFFAGGVVVFAYYFSVFHEMERSHAQPRGFIDVS